MAQPRVYEGTPQELAPYLAQRPNQRFRLIELPTEDKEPIHVPNEEVLAMLRETAAMKVGMQSTDGSETDRLLREARAGGMYGDNSSP